MEPLKPVPMPSHAVLVELDARNTWRSPARQHGGLYLAFVATDSSEPLSFLSLHSAAAGVTFLSALARRAHAAELHSGVVIELQLEQPLTGSETVTLALAQAGATAYYPAQPISD